jgi:hypothetical protein
VPRPGSFSIKAPNMWPPPIDGFGMEAPDSEENAEHFGYAGKKGGSAFPFVRMAALAECGTHTIVAAEIAKDGEGEETLARRILLVGAADAGMIGCSG